MTSKLKGSLGFILAMALVPAISFAQDTPTTTSKKKKAKVKTEAAQTSAAETAASPTSTPTPAAPLTEPSSGVRLAPGETLNFNTDGAPAAKDKAQVAPGYSFKASDAPMQAQPVTYADQTSEDAGFKTYIGYPKNRFSANVHPIGIAAVWNYKGNDFNFRSQTTAFGVAYDFVATPRFGMGVEYNHMSYKVDAALAVNNQFNVQSSTSTMDTYFLRTHYCWFGSQSFNMQYCPEFVIGNDAYPILGFVNSTDLKMDKVQDLVVGVNMKFQIPVSDHVFLHLIPGYLVGTGIGNSGTLTSKNNSTAYGLLGGIYEINSHHSLSLDFTVAMRNAKLNGTIGNNTGENWTTKSTEIGGKLAYIFTL